VTGMQSVRPPDEPRIVCSFKTQTTSDGNTSPQRRVTHRVQCVRQGNGRRLLAIFAADSSCCDSCSAPPTTHRLLRPHQRLNFRVLTPPKAASIRTTTCLSTQFRAAAADAAFRESLADKESTANEWASQRISEPIIWLQVTIRRFECRDGLWVHFAIVRQRTKLSNG
jgi:hypothetical protein